MLLTRSPLSTRASPGFSFDLHVLGAPPAFVLSQDQTLHRDLNPTKNPVECEIGESPVRVTSAPFRQLCTTAPEGCSPCGIDDDVSRDTPALAFGVTVPFSRSYHSTPEPLRALRPQPFRERRADTHLCLHHSRDGRGRREASVSIHSENVLRADWRYYGLAPGSASRDTEFVGESKTSG